MIHVVDYGLGNVQAFLTLYKRLGFEATRAKTADLAGASKIILPGVGAFDHAIELLDQSACGHFRNFGFAR
jgi:glutamine amidotransferase